MKIGLGIASQKSIANLWNNPTPAIFNFGGTVGAYDPVTRTMTNTGATVAGYPRFQFPLGLTVAAVYQATGTVTGNFNKVSPVRLANTGAANNFTYSTVTGVLSGTATAAATYVEFGTSLVAGESAVIASINIRPA